MGEVMGEVVIGGMKDMADCCGTEVDTLALA